MEFRTDRLYEALKTPLGLVEDGDRRAAMERYVDAARLPLDIAVYQLVSDMVSTVDDQLAPTTRTHVTYKDGALHLTIERREVEEPITLAEAEWTRPDGEMEKITIRLPGELKNLVTQAAAGSGLSVNSWLIRALAHAVRGALRNDSHDERHGYRGRRDEFRARQEDRRGGRGNRLSGWIGGE